MNAAHRHYLDHASTSPIRPEARLAMVQWLETGVIADPGRLHAEGRAARAPIETARQQVAELLGARPREVVFTSGATEAAVSAIWSALSARPGPIVCADVEHSSVREASRREAAAHQVPLLVPRVDPHGRIDVEHLGSLLDKNEDISLVNCQLANHEVGSLQAAATVAEMCRRRGVLVHVDAAAAAGHVDLDFGAIDADLCSISAHKMGGPPGAGVLLVRRGLRLDPLMVGGAQERSRRAGLENTAAIVGLGAVAAALTEEGVLERERERASRQAAAIRQAILRESGSSLFGDPEHCLPHIVCAGLEDVEAEPVLLALDQAGIAVHSGSSCSSEALEPSPVLRAMGADADRSLRVSVGWSTTEDDVSAFLAAFPDALRSLRALRS